MLRIVAVRRPGLGEKANLADVLKRSRRGGVTSRTSAKRYRK
jgi:hypothetical protein